MYQLTEEQAQNIVDKMMRDIPYSINIMNDQGIIIGSGTKKRVGTVHQGAVEALSTGKMIEVWKDGPNEKQGTNEPIVIDNKRVGVIGITGNPDEVRPFCNIVKTAVSLLIEQGTTLIKLEREANRKKAFIETLLEYHGNYSQKFRKEAMHYQIDLLLKSTVLYVKHLNKQDQSSGILKQYKPFLFPTAEDAHIMIVQDENDVIQIIRALLHVNKHVQIGLGRLEANVAESYQQAKRAMNVLTALKLPTRIASYEKVEFLVKLGQAELTNEPNVLSKLEDTADLLETLRSFILNQCSMTLTAEELNIHRNTLQYRLKRINSLTGKDPRNVLQLFELMYGLLTLHQT